MRVGGDGVKPTVVPEGVGKGVSDTVGEVDGTEVSPIIVGDEVPGASVGAGVRRGRTSKSGAVTSCHGKTCRRQQARSQQTSQLKSQWKSYRCIHHQKESVRLVTTSRRSSQ